MEDKVFSRVFYSSVKVKNYDKKAYNLQPSLASILRTYNNTA
jgi:hypothetical protein